MKRISTLLACACLAVASQKTAAQCTLGTPAPSQSTFNQFTSNAENFTGFTYTPSGSGSTGMLTSAAIPKGISSQTLITRTYSLAAGVPTIYLGFDLSGPGTGDITGIKVEMVYNLNGTPTTVTVCNSQINFANANATYTVSAPNPLSGSTTLQNVYFKITFTFDENSNGGPIINIDNFFSGPGIGAAAAALPVNFTGLEAKKVSNGTQLTWTVAQEVDVLSYELQRSTDGKNFTAVSSVSANGKSSYSATDYASLSSVVYYRVKNVDNDGRYKYSITIKVEGGKVSFLKKAFPMPAINEVFVQHDAAVSGAVITLSAQDGRIVKRISVQAGAMQTRIDLSGLNSGMYLARYDDGTGNAESLKVVKQ